MLNSCHYLILAAVLLAPAPLFAQEAKWLEVLRSDTTVEEKSTACRELARTATKDAVGPLAALLGDEKLSHMARYALETIDDPAVDAAFRDALGKLDGGPRLGVIGSLGVRRDGKAVDALAQMLNEDDAAAAAARALGMIGTPAAAKALEAALGSAFADRQGALCEGLLRAAEALAADGQAEASQATYDRLHRLTEAPAQVRAAALRGAILARGKRGIPLMVEAIEGPDYALAAAAVRTAMEMPEPPITDALLAELPQAPAERQGLLILALAQRHESRALPAVLRAAQSGDTQLRILAFRALRRIGDASVLDVLLEAATDDNEQVAQAALDTLESLQDEAVDAQLSTRLSEAQGNTRMVLIELAGRRRAAAAAASLWQAADDSDPAIRAAALASLGAVLEPTELPKLLARSATARDQRESAALDKALRDVALRAEDREVAASQLAAVLPAADESARDRILDTLNAVGGAKSLDAVAAAVRSSDPGLRDAASRVLGEWKSADAAAVLLELHNTTDDPRLKVRAVRGYVRIARQFDMPVEQRVEMCRTALKTATRDEDKRLVLEVLLRYPSDEMRAIALEAAEVPALREEAMSVAAGMGSKGGKRADLGKALAQAGHTPVKLEILKAEYGAGTKTKDVTEILRKYAKNYRVIFLPSPSYNKSFGGDPAEGTPKQLRIEYRIDGKAGAVSLNENATIVLPLPN